MVLHTGLLAKVAQHFWLPRLQECYTANERTLHRSAAAVLPGRRGGWSVVQGSVTALRNLCRSDSIRLKLFRPAVRFLLHGDPFHATGPDPRGAGGGRARARPSTGCDRRACGQLLKIACGVEIPVDLQAAGGAAVVALREVQFGQDRTAAGTGPARGIPAVRDDHRRAIDP